MKAVILFSLLPIMVLSSCQKEKVTPQVYQIFDVTNSGLPSNFVNVLEIDNNSIIWIGTFANGIVKYDGTNWTNYNTHNSGLSNDSISSIAVDGLNRVWVGTANGVSMFDQQKWTSYNLSNSEMRGKNILALTTDSKNMVWISSTSKDMERSGVYTFDGSRWQFFNERNSILPHYLVTTLAVDKDNTVWIGTGVFLGKGGLIKVQEHDWQIYNVSNSSLKFNWVDDISFSSKNELLISSPVSILRGRKDELAGYLQTFDGDSKWTDLSPANQDSTLSNRVYASAYDNEDNIWIATSIDQLCTTCNYSLSKYDGESWTIFSEENGNFPRTFISDIKVDKYNTVWIAAGDVGLIKIVQK